MLLTILDQPVTLDMLSIFHANANRMALLELAVAAGEGRWDASGAFVATTGEHTGRSPKDRFIVQDATSRETVDWGGFNQPLSEAHFAKLKDHALAHAAEKDLYVQDLYVSAEASARLNVRVYTERAWHAAFARTLLRRPKSLEGYKADWTFLHLPSCEAIPELHGTRSGTFIVVSFQEQLVMIGGTHYAGEIKKSAFGLLNYDLPGKGMMPMHCSANKGADGSTALFFGLSGTGKTTLSADKDRALIGDDEHGWNDAGIFNFEGGCYAKAIDLSAEKEPEIYAASQRPGAILENVVLDAKGKPDFSDISLTENTRCAYPLDHIEGFEPSSAGGPPTHLIFLTLDAYGVLPPVSKLTPEQAAYHFLSGYTAKVAGTEKGLGKEPQATFSTCYGAPFMPRRPQVYADLLKDKLAKHATPVWLINTGWIGGAYGMGQRISLTYSRAILDSSLAAQEFVTEAAFGLAVPTACKGVPSGLLMPRKNWPDSNAYDLTAAKLNTQFRENAKSF